MWIYGIYDKFPLTPSVPEVVMMFLIWAYRVLLEIEGALS